VGDFRLRLDGLSIIPSQPLSIAPCENITILLKAGGLGGVSNPLAGGSNTALEPRPDWHGVSYLPPNLVGATARKMQRLSPPPQPCADEGGGEEGRPRWCIVFDGRRRDRSGDGTAPPFREGGATAAGYRLRLLQETDNLPQEFGMFQRLSWCSLCFLFREFPETIARDPRSDNRSEVRATMREPRAERASPVPHPVPNEPRDEAVIDEACPFGEIMRYRLVFD